MTLCERSGVSYSALRNRISDLRVYHAMNIESSRIKDGLWSYELKGKMTAREHAEYLLSIQKKRAVGDKRLWGELLRCIYEYTYCSPEFKESKLDWCYDAF